jgi:LAGLIDADG-like domain
MSIINLKKPEHAYFYGFAQTDGHLYEMTRNRGRFSIEICKKDEFILKEFQKIFSILNINLKERMRNTNFKNNYTSSIFNIYNLDFRNELKQLGYPIGKKSDIVIPPIEPFSEIDYIRGLIDGDGSIGFDKNQNTFISFTTASDNMKNYYCNFLQNKIGIIKNVKRNNRDNIYNIVIYNKDVKELSKLLYYENCLSLPRKYEKARTILKY